MFYTIIIILLRLPPMRTLCNRLADRNILENNQECSVEAVGMKYQHQTFVFFKSILFFFHLR